MKKLDDLLVGFTTSEHANSLKKEMEALTNESTELSIYNQEAAAQAFTTEASNATLGEEWIRFFQRNMGGGPSEFLRDVKEMNADEALVVVHTKTLEPKDVEDLKRKYKALRLKKAKHFGSFGVEHLTTEPGHREELPT